MTAELRARQALRSAGLGGPADCAPVRVVNAVNEVWRCGPYMLRVNPRPGSTRLQHEAALLARLPVAVRAPESIAAGAAVWGEWMLTNLIEGRELSRVWTGLSDDERRRSVTELAGALRALHATPVPLDIPPADRDGTPHPLPVSRLLGLVADAAHLPGVDAGLMKAVSQRLAALADVVDDDSTTLVHGDLHLENVLASSTGDITAVLDFEWSEAGPPDLDLDILVHSLATPDLHAASGDGGKLHRRDFDEVVGWLEDAYPELFAHPRLPERLWVYRLAYDVNALLHEPPAQAARFGSVPPHHPYQRIVRLLEDRSDLRWYVDH